ncbi:hypothetical protein J6590_042934 [Homalodisca vitripennis]|nr:hypothetical protein J6590_042934 [Homalodisca vitripennis]
MQRPGHDTSGERRASSGTRASPERRGWSRYKRRECVAICLRGLAVPSTLSGAAHCRSPLKSIVTPLFTFARQHMGPDCKALAERCRSDARRSYRARGLT